MLYDRALKLNAVPNISAPVLHVIGTYMQIVQKDAEEPLSSRFVYDQIKDRGLVAGIFSYWILCRYVANKNNLVNFLDIGTTAVALIGVADTLNVVRTGDSKNQPLGNIFLRADEVQKRKRKTAADRLEEDLDIYIQKSSNWFTSKKELDDAAANVKLSGQAAFIQALIGDDDSSKKKKKSIW